MKTKQRRSVQLGLEALEGRCVPAATYYWHPGGTSAFTTASNWEDSGGGTSSVVPGINDSIIFGGTYGTNSPCVLDAADQHVFSMETDTGWSSTLTLKSVLDVGENDTGGTGFFNWGAGSIEFDDTSASYYPYLNIYSTQNATTGYGFIFDGGNVGESGSFTGQVSVFAGSLVSFQLANSTVHWGADLWTQAALGGEPAAEVDMVSTGGVNHQLDFDYSETSRGAGNEPQILNHGTWQFEDPSSSSSRSGIVDVSGNVGASQFLNVGNVYFKTSTNHTYLEGLPMLNGQSGGTAGFVTIYDGVKATFNGPYVDATYGDTVFYQANTSSTIIVADGSMVVDGSVVISQGGFIFANQSGKTNNVNLTDYSSTETLWIDGGYLEGSTLIGGGGNTTLNVSGVQIDVGYSNSGSSKVIFDVWTPLATTYFPQISMASNTFTTHAGITGQPVFSTSTSGTPTGSAYYTNVIVASSITFGGTGITFSSDNTAWGDYPTWTGLSGSNFRLYRK